MYLKFNFVKIQDFNDKWYTYSPISSQKLSKLLKKSKNAYISKNKFLFYKEHPTYNFQNRLFKEYPLIDIDGQNFNSREECINYFLGMIKFLKENNIKIEEIVCTNTTIGGFQILLSPDCQEDFYMLVENHPQRFSAIDKRVFDTKRVRRLPSTYNGNRGSYSFEIPKDLNISEIREYLSPLFPHDTLSFPSIVGFNNHSSMECGEGVVLENHPLDKGQPPYALGMPHLDKQFKDTLSFYIKKGYFQYPYVALKNAKKGVFRQEADDNEGSGMNFPPVQHIGQDKAIKSPLPALFLVKEVSNSVYGCSSLYCPVIKSLRQPSRKYIKKLQKAQIGDLYVFKTHIGYQMISPKTASLRRLEKIYKRLKCWKSLNELIFKQNWMYISDIYDLKQKQKLDTFELLDIYEQDAKGQYSKPHLAFLQKFYKKEYPNLVGAEKPKVYNAVFTTND